MKTLPTILALALLSGATAVSATPAIAPAHPMAMQAAAPADVTATAPKLDAALRSLWHGHVVHTRDYALAVHAHDTAKAKAAADAVVANAKQIADAVGGFYGHAAGAKMLQLLAGHWGGVKALTDARAANDAAAQSKAMADLNRNVDAIAKQFPAKAA